MFDPKFLQTWEMSSWKVEDMINWSSVAVSIDRKRPQFGPVHMLQPFLDVWGSVFFGDSTESLDGELIVFIVASLWPRVYRLIICVQCWF